jgi:hypothetical protein
MKPIKLQTFFESCHVVLYSKEMSFSILFYYASLHCLFEYIMTRQLYEYATLSLSLIRFSYPPCRHYGLKKTPWSESASELQRPSDRCHYGLQKWKIAGFIILMECIARIVQLVLKLKKGDSYSHILFIKLNSVALVRERTIPTDWRPLVGEVSAIVCGERHVVSVTDPYGRILGFLDRSRYFFFQVAPQLYSRGWVDPVPDSLLLRKSSSAGNITWTSGSVARNSDHWTTGAVYFLLHNIYKLSSNLTGNTIHLRCVARNSDHLTTEAVYFLLHNIYKFSSYLTGSIIHLRSVARISDH